MKDLTTKSINRALVLSITTVLLFILAVFGITYAFFSISVSGNEYASSIVLNIADLGIVTFTDGNVINAQNIYPMYPEDRETKTFTIESVGNTVNVDYTVYLTVTINTFIEQFGQDFTYTIEGTSDSGGSATGLTAANVPTTPGKYEIAEGMLMAGGDLHTYTFTIGLNELESNQNINQGKEFGGSLSVESKKYTHDRSIWGD